MKLWSREAEQEVLDTPVFTVYDRLMSMPETGKSGHFFVIEASSWVNVIAMTEDNRILIVRQFRQGTGDISWEIPGGVIDEVDANPMAAAKRELAEETGYTSDCWEELGRVSTNPAIFSNYCYFYLATHCSKTVAQHLDPFEDIVPDLISLQEFLDRVSDGRIHHSLVVAAVAKLMLKKPELIK